MLEPSFSDATSGYPVYQCPKCKKGKMLLTTQEEHEYSEHFVCENCQHHTRIITKSILVSQALCGVLGIMVSIYIMLNSFKAITGDAPVDMLSEGAQVVGAIFLTFCFTYLIYASHQGFEHRKRYLGIHNH